MPQIPIIVPLIVIGLVVGSIMKSRSAKISKKRLASASVGAGLVNSAYAYLLYLLTPVQIPTRFTGNSETGPPSFAGFAVTSEASFIVASFLAALLMVLLTLGVGMVYSRGGKEEIGETSEQVAEEEQALPQD